MRKFLCLGYNPDGADLLLIDIGDYPVMSIEEEVIDLKQPPTFPFWVGLPHDNTIPPMGEMFWGKVENNMLELAA